MRKFLLTFLAISFATTILAQEEEKSPWACTGVVGLNASATGLVNWSAGGNNNVNGVAFGKVRLLYQENNLSWETNVDLEYGLSYIEQDYDAFQKSSDKLNLNTKFGWQFHKAWFLTASADFKSQLAPGRKYGVSEAYDPIISKFLAPALCPKLLLSPLFLAHLPLPSIIIPTCFGKIISLSIYITYNNYIIFIFILQRSRHVCKKKQMPFPLFRKRVNSQSNVHSRKRDGL